MIEVQSFIPYGLSPVGCWCCREKGDESSNRDYFISTGKDTFDEGRVYICSSCFAEMVRLAPDAVSKAEMEAMLDSQSQFISIAKKQSEKYDILISLAKELGFDLEMFLEKTYGRLLNSADAVPTGIDSETATDDRTSDSEPEPSSKSDPGITGALSFSIG